MYNLDGTSESLSRFIAASSDVQFWCHPTNDMNDVFQLITVYILFVFKTIRFHMPIFLGVIIRHGNIPHLFSNSSIIPPDDKSQNYCHNRDDNGVSDGRGVSDCREMSD